MMSKTLFEKLFNNATLNRELRMCFETGHFHFGSRTITFPALGKTADIPDLVQEAFLLAWRKRRHYLSDCSIPDQGELWVKYKAVDIRKRYDININRTMCLGANLCSS